MWVMKVRLDCEVEGKGGGDLEGLRRVVRLAARSALQRI